MSLYLILNIGSFIIPFLYSFEKRVHFISKWKTFFPSLLIIALFFIMWDIWFNKTGVWGFNPRYHSGFEIFGLPIEEWLFIICIPYASLFIHFAFQHFFSKLNLTIQTVSVIYYLIIVVVLPVIIFNYDKWYTAVNYSVLLLLLSYTYFENPEIFADF